MAIGTEKVFDYTDLTPTTVRVIWRKQKSGWKKFPWPKVTDSSHILISTAECQLGPTYETGTRMRGDAPMRAEGIVPYNGGVEFFLWIGWNDALDIMTDITVFSPSVRRFTHDFPLVK